MGNKSSRNKSQSKSTKSKNTEDEESLTQLYSFGKEPVIQKQKKNLQKIKTIKNITRVAPGYIITDSNNNHWIHGSNSYGCLGNGKSTNVSRWEKMTFFADNLITIKDVRAFSNGFMTFWITDKKELYGNGYGPRLGMGLTNEVETVCTPTKIDGLRNIIDVQCSTFCNIALCGETITDTNEMKYILSYWMDHKDINIPDDITLIIVEYFGKIKTKVYYTGLSEGFEECNTWMPMFKHDLNLSIVKIRCGIGHYLFIDNEGKVYACGGNHSGALGIDNKQIKVVVEPTLLTYFVQNQIYIKNIECCCESVLALDTSGNIYAWGENQKGQCACDPRKYKQVHQPRQVQIAQSRCIVEIQCEYNNCYAKSSDNKHFLWGSNICGQCELEVKRTGSHRSASSYKFVPVMIDDLFYSKTNAVIQDVYLCGSVIYVVGIKQDKT